MFFASFASSWCRIRVYDRPAGESTGGGVRRDPRRRGPGVLDFSERIEYNTVLYSVRHSGRLDSIRQ